MSIFKSGARVGVIGRTTDTGIDFLGYGVYEGELQAPPESKRDGHFGCVKLDKGGEVWAYEWEGCGAEERLREFLQGLGRPVREITLEDFRKLPALGEDEVSLKIASEEGVRVGIEMGTTIVKAAGELVRQTGDLESAGSFMMNVSNTIAAMTIFNICGAYVPEKERTQLYRLIMSDVSRALLLVAQKYVEGAEAAPTTVSEPSKIVIP